VFLAALLAATAVFFAAFAVVFADEATLVIVLPFVDVFDMVFDVVVFIVDVLVVDVFKVAVLALVRLVLVFELLADSPQAIPSALIAKTAERAITFFMIELILLSSSKINNLFYRDRRKHGRSSQTLYFWNIRQYTETSGRSQPQNCQKNHFFNIFCPFWSISSVFATFALVSIRKYYT
jgi:hypothetical protein